MHGSSGTTLPHSDGRDRHPGRGPVRPCLILVLCGDDLAARTSSHSLGRIDEVILGRGPRRATRSDSGGVRRLELFVPDPWVSGRHARIVRVLGRFVLEDQESRNGTFVNGIATRQAELQDGDVLEVGHTFFVYRDAVPAEPSEPDDIEESASLESVPGVPTWHEPFRRQLAEVPRIASSRVSVVLRGESGTGKEVLARAVHALSGRQGPFIAVNCGALPEALVQSELFGYRKGAFSGASEDRTGLVRSAHGGTLFLDEIGDLPASAQAVFLRVLQEQEVLPLGAVKPTPVDFRLVAATHRDIDGLVARGEFRADLFARISGHTLTLPPLRRRREDMGLLVRALVGRAVGDRARDVRLSCEAARRLMLHDWPLNVRELEKTLEAALVRAGDGPVEPWHLPESVRGAGAGSANALAAGMAEVPPIADPAAAEPTPGGKTLSSQDQELRTTLEKLLREHGGNVSAVARAMGKARMQIQRWVRRFGIDPGSYRR